MTEFKNLDKAPSYAALKAAAPADLHKELNAERILRSNIPVGGGLTFNYACRPVTDASFSLLQKLADEQQVIDKYKMLLSGEVMNTGEKRLVMHQLKNPGAPFIFGIVASTMDMKASVSCYGGAELPVMHAAVGQLARFYHLPCYGTGGCSDSNAIDAQAGAEAAFSNVIAALSGTNLVHDNAYLGAGLLGSLEMILMNSDIIGYVKRLQQGIEVSDESLCVDLIDKVGPGGQFMTEMHTFSNYKKETYYPEFMNRRQYQAWLLEGGKDVREVLNQKVREIVEAETEKLLSDDMLKEYDKIIVRREKEIAEGRHHREDF